MYKLIKIILTLFISAFLLHGKAQEGSAPDQEVMTGAEHEYSVALHEGNSYTWIIEAIDGEGDASTLITSASANIFTINWTTTGKYKITVTEKTVDDCEASRQLIVWCQPNNSDLLVNDVVACAQGTGTTTLKLPVTVTNFVAPWILKYQVEDEPPLQVTVNEATYEILQEMEENDGGSPTIKEVQIIDVYDKYNRKPASLNGGALSFPVTFKLTLNQLPLTTEIEYN